MTIQKIIRLLGRFFRPISLKWRLVWSLVILVCPTSKTSGICRP